MTYNVSSVTLNPTRPVLHNCCLVAGPRWHVSFYETGTHAEAVTEGIVIDGFPRCQKLLEFLSYIREI